MIINGTYCFLTERDAIVINLRRDVVLVVKLKRNNEMISKEAQNFQVGLQLEFVKRD